MNEHPLGTNLTELSYDDLEKKLTELNKRWSTAKRMNMDQTVLYQLDLMLQSLEYEKQRRALQLDQTSGVVIDTDGDYAKAK